MQGRAVIRGEGGFGRGRLHLLIWVRIVVLDVGDVDILSEQLLTVLGRTDDGRVEVQEVDLLERETLSLG